MYFITEDRQHIRLEDSRLVKAIMQEHLPGWDATLNEYPRCALWDTNRSFAWRLSYPKASSFPSLVQIAEEQVEVAPIMSVLQGESVRVTRRLLERLQAEAEKLATETLPGKGWIKRDGIWITPEATAAYDAGDLYREFLRQQDREYALRQWSLAAAFQAPVSGGPISVRPLPPQAQYRRVWRAFYLTGDPVEEPNTPAPTREDRFAQHLISRAQEHSA